MLRGSVAAVVLIICPTTTTALAQSEPNPAQRPAALSLKSPAPPGAPVQCKFRLIIVRGASPNPPTEIEFDYSSVPPVALAVEGIGIVPSRGTLHFATRSRTLRFLDPNSNAVLASYELAQQIELARTELDSLGGSPAERLRRSEILHMLGEDAVAIPDLALLASAGSLPLSTRNFASLQLGRAFAAEGDMTAALAQYERVSRSASPSARGEALVRSSSAQIRSGNEAGAERSIESFFGSKTASASPYAPQAQANQMYLTTRKDSPATFSSTTPLLSTMLKADDDARDIDFQELPGIRSWRNVETYEVVIESLWQDIFKQPPGDYPCHAGVFCSTTPYWDLPNQINGRFARVAFRVSRWYAADTVTTRNVYKIEYTAQEEIADSPNSWAPVKDEAVRRAIRSLLNDLADRLRILGKRA